jgi:hypothetical protein
MISHQDHMPITTHPTIPVIENQLVKVRNEPTYSSILGKYDPMSNSSGSLSHTVIKSRCLHNGCPMMFDTQRDLRSHLFSHAPGLAAEFKAMTNTMLNLIQMIETWDIKSPQEKARNLEYVGTVKEALTDYPLLTDGPTIPDPASIPAKPEIRRSVNDFESFVIQDSHDDRSVFSGSTNSEYYSDHANSPRIRLPLPSTAAVPIKAAAMDADDELDFLDSILLNDSTSDLISDYAEDQEIVGSYLPLCMDCKPVNQTKSASSCCDAGHSTIDCSCNENIIDAEEVQRYGKIASSLASPLIQARNEIVDGWSQHLVQAAVPVEEHAADNGRKRRIIS